jgi:surfactin synthase thioesterase subunit
MASKYRVVQIKGAKPELFIVVGIDFDEHSIKSTSRSMSEAELQEHLRQAGAAPEEISTWIGQAKTYPG